MTGPSKEENMKTARICNLSISPEEALLAISALFSLIFLADALSSEIKIQVKSRDQSISTKPQRIFNKKF